MAVSGWSIHLLALFGYPSYSTWYERVGELAAQGLLAPDTLLNTLTQMIEQDVLNEEAGLLYAEPWTRTASR